MDNDWRQVGFFAAGLAIGAVASAMIVLGPYSPVGRNKVQAQPGPSQPIAAAFRGSECPMEPAATIAGAKDGRYRMPADLSGYAATDPNVFIVMGTEAAATGRPHDAEIAYLMACRVADRFQGAGSAAAADARYELARHYGTLANAADKGAPNCGDLLLRAETMYSDSLQLYRASYGPDHERSRLAAQGLAGVRQTLTAQAGVPPGAPPSAAPAVSADAGAPRQDAPVMRSELPTGASAPGVSAKPQARAAPPDKPAQRPLQKKVAARQAPQSPACAAARTTAERLICSDAELARLDREVGYLQARARNAWKYETEWRRRESQCRDRACLMQLMAAKRSQLMAEINSA
ncbi:MAG: hypothetical protein Q8R01_01900 [Ramlibacter sp.]|nr:hypothetical protein [Ramlibacter sp.]